MSETHVQPFIEGLDNLYHPHTYAFYGHKIDSDGTLAWMKTSITYPKNRHESDRRLPNNYREMPLSFNRSQMYVVASSKTPDDGTVPVESLSAICRNSEIKNVLATGVDHQGAYDVDSLKDIQASPAVYPQGDCENGSGDPDSMNTIRQFIALSLMAGSVLFIAQATASTPVQKNSPVINTLFAQTKPQCIGRYVIDVPRSFNNQLHDMIFIDDFKIESKPLYPPAFKQRVQLREQALRDAINKPENESVNAPFIKEKIVLPDGKGIIFDRNVSGEDDLGRVLEAHFFVNMTAFVITTEILDLSSQKYIERRKTYIKAGFTEAQMNEKPAKLAALQSLISRLSGRKDEDIPSAKGVCIPNGFIRDDGGKHLEKITFSYENDDFILGVYTNNTYAGSNDTLFNRTAEIDKTLKIANQHTIKKYALSPGGVPAQVWLSSGPQNVGKNVNPLYEFDLYANEAEATPTKPWLTMGINNFDKKTRYSEAQMIEIWDRLVNSLRYK